MYLCNECKNNISKKGMGSHLKNNHNITAKEYYDKTYKKENEGICENCRKETTFLGISKGYNRFCSCKCAQLFEETKKKQRKKKLGISRPDMIGENNPAKRNDVKKKLSKSKKENWKSGVYNSREYRQKLSVKISNTLSGVSYEKRHGIEKTKELKEKRRQHMLNGHAQDMCSKIVCPSKPQLELYEMVKSIIPEAELEYRVNNYSLDIAIPSIMIDIEYDCSYWHTKEKDSRRNKYLESLGWRVIRFVDRIPTIEELQETLSANVFATSLA